MRLGENGSGMVDYRVYTVDGDGHIVKSTPLICDDDVQAVEQAREISKGDTLEIWSGDRLVARLSAER
jgi:hypothetical protein